MKRYIKSAVQPFSVKNGHDIDDLKEIVSDVRNTPQMLKEYIDDYSDFPDVLAEVVRNPNMTSELLDYMITNGIGIKGETLRSMAGSEKATPNALYKLNDVLMDRYFERGLSNSELIAVHSLALNDNTPLSVLYELSRVVDDDTRRYIIFNKNTDVDLLCQIVKINHQLIKSALESPLADDDFIRKVTSDDFLRDLRNDTERVAVCYSIASYPNTPPDVLDKLAHAEGSYTRGAVAQNPNTSKDTLYALTEDSDWIVAKTAEIHWLEKKS